MFKCKHKECIKKYYRDFKYKDEIIVYYEYCEKCHTLLKGGVTFVKKLIEETVNDTKCSQIKNDTSLNNDAIKETEVYTEKNLGKLIKNTVKQYDDAEDENNEEDLNTSTVIIPKERTAKRLGNKKRIVAEGTCFVRKSKGKR